MIHLTLKSTNQKTGPIPVSTSTSTTCPPSCPFYRGGCYAKHNPRGLGGHWKKVSSGARGTDWDTFCAMVARFSPRTLWRHNQAGDLPGRGERINGRMLAQLVKANRKSGARGFAYTHKRPEVANNAKHIAAANKSGFTINLSGNSPSHADALADLAIAPVVTVIADATVTSTPAGRKIVLCPAQRENSKIQCASCGLCAIAERPFVIGFLPHGNGAKAVRAIASQNS